MTFRLWGDLTADELKAAVTDATVALLPVGAIEQHGPHLPLATDTILAESVALQVAETVEDATVLVLPTVSVAKSDEHISFPGTLTLNAETLIAALVQTGASVGRAGIRRIVFLNAHGGNVPVLQIVIRRLRVEQGMFAVSAGWLSMGYPEGIVSDEEMRDGIHGGFVETAAMLHLRPDLVDMSRAADFVPASRGVAEDNDVLRLLGPVSAGWAMQDLHPLGAAGNAMAADAEAGRRIVEHAAARYARLVEEVARHDINDLRSLT